MAITLDVVSVQRYSALGGIANAARASGMPPKWRTLQHPIAKYALPAVALAAILWWPVWMLDTGPLAHFLHTGFEVFYGTFTIVLLCLVTTGAAFVAVWDITKDAPEKHKHIHFKPLMHH